MSPSSSSKERAKSLLLFLIFCNILFLQCTSFIQKPVTFNPVHGKIQIALPSRISRLCEAANDRNECLPIFDDRKRLKVLCLHGYLSSSKYFRLQLRRLVDEASDISEFGNKKITVVFHTTATIFSLWSHYSFIAMLLLYLSISGWPTSVWTSEATST